MLRSHGCDEAQGYHYARPMPAADLETFLRTHVTA
jgi:EAL domain-containing protein (putative c-di-GMP-specific phosphodiesterase class I)